MDESPNGHVEFERLAAGRGDVDLVELMLELASDRFDAEACDACRREIDRLGQVAMAVAGPHTAESVDLEERLRRVSRTLYVDERFRGNAEAYYDPENSYLPSVVRERRGIPITLGIVYMRVAADAGLGVYGVPAPGHFVLACDEWEHRLFVDPFVGGDVLRFEACRARIARMTGVEGKIDRLHFRKATPLEIFVRVLRNLKMAYLKADRWDEVFPVQQRLVRLVPEAADEQRDLGLVCLRTGAIHEAIRLLKGYLESCPQDERKTIERYLAAAQRAAAEMN